MKKITKKLSKAVTNLAFKVSEANANTTCVFYAYQPKLPKSVEKLRKF